ncbi:MAG TPA: S66 peptidase family protein [Candidatus Paceibacterota bacterium]
MFFDSLISPPRLKQGGKIGIVAPSAGLAALFPHRTDNGIQMLEKMGFSIVVAKHARQIDGWVSASAEERADDINAMFASPDVNAIIATIGGNHANQILKYLDYELIARNPKPFIGYSDITVLHYALAVKAHLRTFYGPCLISEFAEYPEILPYTQQSFEKALMDSSSPQSAIAASETWTDEFLDWFTKKDLERARKMNIHHGYEWWREGESRGPTWGGAVPSMNHLAGTEYWVDPAGCIFFVDIPEGGPGQKMPMHDLDTYLSDLDNLGVFASISGLVIGRPYQYESDDNALLKKIVMSYVGQFKYPILFNANIGHTAPILTVPLGTKSLLRSSDNLFSLEESGVV